MLYDAHCHPTDAPESLSEIERMDATLVLMATRFDDLDLVRSVAKIPNVIPAFGLHPWFTHMVKFDPNQTKIPHYKSVLHPPLEQCEIDALPEPIMLSDHLSRIENALKEHPGSLVGEVGLDKAFRVRVNGRLLRSRVKMSHQVAVLEAQLELAQRLRRPVSLHGVQATSALLDTVKQFPKLPGVCLHSYSGHSDFLVNHWMRLEMPVYVSVAVLINITTDERAEKIISAVPQESILTESDFHEAGDRMFELIDEALAKVCKFKGWSREKGTAIVEKNFWNFVGDNAQVKG